MHIGLKIKKRRSLLGLTQSDVAHQIGVTFQQFHKYEIGINKISASQLYYVAKLLKIDINYFIQDIQDVKINILS